MRGRRLLSISTPEMHPKNKYLILRKRDNSEWSLITGESKVWQMFDLDGNIMIILRIFEAKSWNAAKKIYEKEMLK